MRGSRAISRTTTNTEAAAASRGSGRSTAPSTAKLRTTPSSPRRRVSTPNRSAAANALHQPLSLVGLERSEDGSAEIDAGRQRLTEQALRQGRVGEPHRDLSRLHVEHRETGVGGRQQPFQALLALRRDPLEGAARGGELVRHAPVLGDVDGDRVGDDRAVGRVAGLRAVGQPPDGAVARHHPVDDLHRVLGRSAPHAAR